MFGYTSPPNYELAKLMETPPGWLDNMRSNWQLLVPCLLALVAALFLALAERGFRAFDPRKIPPLARLWPWRLWILIALTGFTSTLLVIQASYGFGLENAIRKVVIEKLGEEREKAAKSPSLLLEVEYKEKLLYEKFNLEHTTWCYLGIGCNFLALLALFVRIDLDKRGSKPPPRIVIQY
jgi:hypothetical protein